MSVGEAFVELERKLHVALDSGLLKSLEYKQWIRRSLTS